MRFSIRVLLLAVFLIAILCAAFLSERPGKRYTRVAAIDFSPAVDQLAVSVLECNGFTDKEATVFDRIISIVEFPTLKFKYVVRRDRQKGSNKQNYRFWNWQADVVHTKSHLLFLDRDLRSLMIKDIETGELKEWARFKDGTIFSFDASSDAGLIVANGEASPLWMEGREIEVDGETYIVPTGKSALEMIKKEEGELEPFGIVSNLGIGEPEMITVPMRGDDPEIGGSASSDSDSEKQDEWRIDRPRELPHYLRYVARRQVAVVPRDEADHKDADAIGIITGAVSLEVSADSLKPVGTLNAEPSSHRWKDSVFDFAASQGPCRFAKLLENDQLLLNIATDQFPEITDNVNLRVRWMTSPESVIELSKSGGLVAGSENKKIRLLETSDLISSHAVDIAEQIHRDDRIEVTPEIRIIEHNAAVTAMAFSPDEEFLITGDAKGRLSVYEIASGELVSQVRAMKKTRGLPFPVVILMFAAWLWFAGSMLLSWFESRQASDDDVQLIPDSE